MSAQTFADRCALSELCLPDAPYLDMLTKLHSEMLQEIERLKATQRQWIGLTAAEKGECAAPTYAETAARIEAKLKEKNT
jgi:hypothetical protein